MLIDCQLWNSRILGTKAYYQACFRYASRQNLCISKVRTNCGKQTIVETAAILWENIPTHLWDLNTFQVIWLRNEEAWVQKF